MKKLLPLLFLLLPCLSFGESQVIPKFRGLNTADSAVLINDDQAQDLQDVDITQTGNGVKKRDGYALYKTIGVSTSAVRGGYYFRDASGNDNIIHTNSLSIFKSVAGAAYSAFVTTDTANSYYDFTDSRGFLWRANSNRDQILKYDGTTLTYYPSHPRGDQIEVMPSRLAISGTTADPNCVNFSADGDFTTFTVGTTESSAYQECVGLPGQKLNAIKLACGADLLLYTRDTTSLYRGANQFSGDITEITNTIGTLQPNSVIQDLGLTYWQGQDGHFYRYDCNTVDKISWPIDVSNFVGGESKLWTQTTKADWDAGTLTYVTSELTSGDVQLSTWSRTDTTTADFSAFSSSSSIVITNDRVYLSTNNTNVENHSFETAGGSAAEAADWTITDGVGGFTPARSSSGSPCDGSFHMKIGASSAYWFQVLDTADVVISSTIYFPGTSCTQRTISTSGLVGKWIKYRFLEGSILTDYVTTTLPIFCSGNSITFYDKQSGTDLYVDLVEGGRSTTYTGTFTSQGFDTAVSSPAWLASGANWTTNSHLITAQTQSSDNGSSWDAAVTWSTGSAPTSVWKRYIRYVLTLSTGGTTNGTALPYVEDVTLAARSSSGTFISQTKNIGSNATSFGTFSADQTLNSGTISYLIRTATTEGGLTSATWIALTRGSQISASINPWIQIKSTFTIATATHDPTMHNFSVAWNEGTITRTFGSVDKDHRLIWSVAEGATSVANVTYIYDPRFDSWLKYSVPFDAPARVGNSIYFGNPSSGNVYAWPSGTSDNGSAITAYWKSKNFISGDPFTEKLFTAYSFLGDEAIGSNIDITYTIDGTAGTTANYSLTDPLSSVARRINARMPSGTKGSLINWKFGNNDADSPFELHGFSYEYTRQPWRVLP